MDTNCTNCDGDFDNDGENDNRGCSQCRENYYLSKDDDGNFVECLCESPHT